MTSASAAQWRRAINLHADDVGSIHDADQAKELGFKAALVSATNASAFAFERLVDRFGRDWYERGFFKQAAIAPLYEVDEFQVLLEPLESHEGDEALVNVALEKRDGTQVTAGYAGLATDPATALRPWQREGERRPTSDAGDPLPEVPIGTSYPAYRRTVTIEDSESRRAMVGDGSPWYTAASPWGGPIAPSFMCMLLGGGGEPEGGYRARPEIVAPMKGTFQLQQFAPLMAGEEHTITGTLVANGFSARSAHYTNEFEVTNAAGDRVAVARQQMRWMAKQPD